MRNVIYQICLAVTQHCLIFCNLASAENLRGAHKRKGFEPSRSKNEFPKGLAIVA